MSSSRPDSKVCTLCEKEKQFDDFSPRRDGVGGRHSQCRECRRLNWKRNAKSIGRKRREAYANQDNKQREAWRASAKRYREKHALKLKSDALERYHTKRRAVLAAYGGACVCCGELSVEFLAIDHEHNNGAEDRRKLGGTTGVYRNLFRKLPELLPGLRVLCHNCNCSLGWYGYCPHQNQ